MSIHPMHLLCIYVESSYEYHFLMLLNELHCKDDSVSDPSFVYLIDDLYRLDHNKLIYIFPSVMHE